MSYKCRAPFSLIYRSIFIATVKLIIVTLSFTHQNFAQMSEPKKCLARFSLIYHSIFITPVRLIIITLRIAQRPDYLWPESRPCLTQNKDNKDPNLIQTKDYFMYFKYDTTPHRPQTFQLSILKMSEIGHSSPPKVGSYSPMAGDDYPRGVRGSIFCILRKDLQKYKR